MAIQDLSSPTEISAGHSESLSFLKSFQTFAADIKLAHSLFALPFAIASIVFIKTQDFHLSAVNLIAFLVCMLSARSFAMGMNRYLDRFIDKENPRTRNRALPAARMQPRTMLFWSAGWAVLFVIAAASLNDWAGLLAFPVLLILGSYSLMKHIGWFVHWYLGACLGLAPIGTAIGLSGTLPGPVLLLAVAVCFWTAGFDILYSLQDFRFDQKKGLQSVPSRFGVQTALWLSRFSFLAMAASLVFAGILGACGPIYYLGVVVASAILFYEHLLVRDVDADGYSTNINAAFFNWNAAVSVLFLAAVLVDYFAKN